MGNWKLGALPWPSSWISVPNVKRAVSSPAESIHDRVSSSSLLHDIAQGVAFNPRLEAEKALGDIYERIGRQHVRVRPRVGGERRP